ncbi:hypothetical protein GmHk_17G047506 [Glycine max]|nr:hypothetical protein GmHk_17G047506 [Glycine max]
MPLETYFTPHFHHERTNKSKLNIKLNKKSNAVSLSPSAPRAKPDTLSSMLEHVRYVEVPL